MRSYLVKLSPRLPCWTLSTVLTPRLRDVYSILGDLNALVLQRELRTVSLRVLIYSPSISHVSWKL